MLQQGVQVGGEGVVVVAGGGLAGLAEPAPVVGDDPVAGLQQGRDLLVPGPAAERVPVDQHHRLAGAVIFVVDIDVAGILPANGDLGHEASFQNEDLAWSSVRYACLPARRVSEGANTHSTTHSALPICLGAAETVGPARESS